MDGGSWNLVETDELLLPEAGVGLGSCCDQIKCELNFPAEPKTAGSFVVQTVPEAPGTLPGEPVNLEENRPERTA